MIQLDVFGISDSKTSRRVWAAAPIHQRTVQVCKIPWYSLNWISKEFVFYERLGIGFSTAKEMLKVKKKPSIYLEKHWWSEIRVTPRRQHIFLSSPLLGSLHILARHLAVAGQQRRQNNKTNGRKKCTWLICCAISLTFVPSWLKWDFNCSISTLSSNVADISRTDVHRFVQEEVQRNFSENRNIQGNQSKDTLNKIRELRLAN